MHPLLLTMAFLTMLTLFVTGDVKRFVSQTSKEMLHRDYLTSKETAERESLLSILHALKEQTAEKKKETSKKSSKKEKTQKKREKHELPLRSLKFDLACLPNNSRLNFSAVLHDDEKTLYHVACRLLRNLYGHTSFFQKDSLLDQKILDALILKREEMKEFGFADELATIALPEELQKAFSAMLAGSLDEQGQPLVPLTDFITFDSENKDKISFLFTSEPILLALLEDNHLVHDLMLFKREMLEMIVTQEENHKNLRRDQGKVRTDIKEILIPTFDAILSANGRDPNLYKKQFDFSLGKMGSYLMTTDPETGLPIRQKIVARRSLKKEHPPIPNPD